MIICMLSFPKSPIHLILIPRLATTGFGYTLIFASCTIAQRGAHRLNAADKNKALNFGACGRRGQIESSLVINGFIAGRSGALMGYSPKMKHCIDTSEPLGLYFIEFQVQGINRLPTGQYAATATRRNKFNATVIQPLAKRSSDKSRRSSNKASQLVSSFYSQKKGAEAPHDTDAVILFQC